MRRRFEPIPGRVETCAEARPTRLRAQPLDPLSLAPHTLAKVAQETLVSGSTSVKKRRSMQDHPGVSAA
jgi:hypothetical protein